MAMRQVEMSMLASDHQSLWTDPCRADQLLVHRRVWVNPDPESSRSNLEGSNTYQRDTLGIT